MSDRIYKDSYPSRLVYLGILDDRHTLFIDFSFLPFHERCRKHAWCLYATILINTHCSTTYHQNYLINYQNAEISLLNRFQYIDKHGPFLHRMDVVRLIIFTDTSNDISFSKSRPKLADIPVISAGWIGMEEHWFLRYEATLYHTWPD